MTRTKKGFEEKLNNDYREWTVEEIIEHFVYLTIERKGPRCTMNKLERSARENTMGALIRKYDPILFSVGYHEWCIK